MTLVPSSAGRPLVWDIASPDTFAASYDSHMPEMASCVAAFAENKKSGKYSHLASSYFFQPVTIEMF